MKKYENPMLEVIELKSVDVIQTSGNILNVTQNGEMSDLSDGKITFN